MQPCESTTIAELMEMPQFAKIRDLIFTNLDDEKLSSKLSDYDTAKTGIYHALNYTAGISLRYDFILPLYTPTECAVNPALGDVCLLNFAVHPGAQTIIICPGGGYNREWVLVEGYPLADEINRLGYNAFILIYRTGKWGLFPKPLDDLARAVSYLEEHQKQLNISMYHYALTGASAGGHLISQWGTSANGYGHYDLPKPGALLMSYPACILTDFYHAWSDAMTAGNTALADGIADFLKRIGSEHFTEQEIAKYSLDTSIDSSYPPVYLVHCEDDTTVPVANSQHTVSVLERLSIPHRTRIVPRGGHSFGIGVHTDAKGWLHDAIRFWENE